MGHGPRDIVGINEDDVQPLMDLTFNSFSVLEQVFTAGGGFGLLFIIKEAVGTLPVAVVVKVVAQELISLVEFFLLNGAKLLHDRLVK